MKKSILFSVLGAATALFYFTHKGYTDINGIAAVSGAPGETTCSNTNCHGAGAGGLADNKGPGAVTLTCSNMTGWKYTAGQTYHFTLVNTDSKAGVFGLSVSALDNATNKSTGTIVVTDAVHTLIKTKTISGSSRQYLTHKDKTGATKTKPGTFTFDWVAPAATVTGVTFYFASLGGNNDGNEDGGDNVYSGKQVAALATTTGFEDELTSPSEISIFPNPAKSDISIMVNGMATTETQYTVFSMNGMKMIENISYKPGAQISLEGWKPGKYFVQMNLNGKSVSKPFIIE